MTPITAALVMTATQFPSLIITHNTHKYTEKANAIAALGVQLVYLGEGFTFQDAMRLLAERGNHRVLIEGGQRLTTAALNSGAASQLYWFKAPLVMGEGGMAALRDNASLAAYVNASPYVKTLPLGGDMLYNVALKNDNVH